jgi:hypothetical protein
MDVRRIRIRNTESNTILAMHFLYRYLLCNCQVCTIQLSSFREDKELSAQMFEATAEEDDGDEEEEDEVGMQKVAFPLLQDY